MNHLEYLQWHRQELNRIDGAYQEARKLGQNEKAKEIMDELYGVCFNHYQLMVKFRRTTKEILGKSKDPRVKQQLGEFERIMDVHNGQYSQMLHRYLSGILKFKALSDKDKK